MSTKGEAREPVARKEGQRSTRLASQERDGTPYRNTRATTILQMGLRHAKLLLKLYPLPDMRESTLICCLRGGNRVYVSVVKSRTCDSDRRLRASTRLAAWVARRERAEPALTTCR